MTIQYISDLSHYDPIITLPIAQEMVKEGIVMATHKVGEGTGGDDPEDGTSLANLRDAGMPILGGYHVVRSGAIQPQIDELLFLANRDEPWWQKFPNWVWQVDLERWSYDNVPASTGIAFGKALRTQTQRPVILYGSHGQYGDELSAWDGPLWNANYGSNPVGNFKTVYPGDNSPGWAAYSGQVPLFLQYGSNVVIAGMTTCDISAFKGTLDQMKAALFGGGLSFMTAADEFFAALQDPRILGYFRGVAWQYDGRGLPGESPTTLNAMYDAVTHAAGAETSVAALTAKVDALAAAVTALGQGGTSVDTTAVLAKIDAVAAQESTTVQALQAQVADLTAKLAAAAKAQATALTTPAQ